MASCRKNLLLAQHALTMFKNQLFSESCATTNVLLHFPAKHWRERPHELLQAVQSRIPFSDGCSRPLRG